MEEVPAAAFAPQHPIRLRVTDDLRRTRLTAFFRLLLAVPHFLWAALVGIFIVLAAIGNWFATLIKGRSPDGLHALLAGYLRYMTHITAYAFLIADPYPGFFLINMKPDYPIDLEVDPPVEQNRWTVAFRIVLAIPALLVTQLLRNLSGLSPSSAGSWPFSRAACRKGSGTSPCSRSAGRRRRMRISSC